MARCLSFTCSRYQAINDGIIKDLTGLAQEYSIKIPVAISHNFYDYITTTEGQSLSADIVESRLHILFSSLVASLEERQQQESEIHFNCVFAVNCTSKIESIPVVAVISPDRNHTPVMTIYSPLTDKEEK